jgi:hypothetical protein
LGRIKLTVLKLTVQDYKIKPAAKKKNDTKEAKKERKKRITKKKENIT